MKVISQIKESKTILDINQVRDIARQVHGGSESVILDDDCIGEIKFIMIQDSISEIVITYTKAKVIDGEWKLWPIQPVNEILPKEKKKEFLEKFKKTSIQEG